MMNVIVHGERGDESKGPMLIQQVDRIDNTAGQTNALVKQIVRLDAARRHDMHTSRVNFGTTRRR
jgi:hypothetical protein